MTNKTSASHVVSVLRHFITLLRNGRWSRVKLAFQSETDQQKAGLTDHSNQAKVMYFPKSDLPQNVDFSHNYFTKAALQQELQERYIKCQAKA